MRSSASNLRVVHGGSDFPVLAATNGANPAFHLKGFSLIGIFRGMLFTLDCLDVDETVTRF
jgi:hypothetical protein